MTLAKTRFLVLVLGLIGVGIFLIWYRHSVHDVPFTPGKKETVWSVEAKIEFEADNNPVKVSFALPNNQPGFSFLAERTASPGYGLSFSEDAGRRRAEWSIRSATGTQTLYYQVDMRADAPPPSNIGLAPAIQNFTHLGPEAAAATELFDAAQKRSADSFTLARELIREFNQQTQQSQLLTLKAPRLRWLVELLNNAGVPAREIHTLFLEDGRRQQDLVPFLQVFNGEQYQIYNPETGEQGRAENQIVWEYSSSIVDVVGGSDTRIGFSMIEQEVPVSQAHNKEVERGSILNFSIHSLPLEEQTLFKGILLIPVGVLIVVFMRILVGLKTSGTFMPVLIALAFIQTSLLTGLISFLSIIALGLVIRSYLSQHNLLLVARIAAVIVLVIFIISFFSVFSFRFGLSEGLKVTFFPMIILAWTIERMSILWEEEGPKEVMRQGGGSLLVAILAFAVMNNDMVKHLTFNFIGLQFIFMAIVLLCGTYTGYRFSELLRFKHFLNRG